jgi:hypothetical protein
MLEIALAATNKTKRKRGARPQFPKTDQQKKSDANHASRAAAGQNQITIIDLRGQP